MDPDLYIDEFEASITVTHSCTRGGGGNDRGPIIGITDLGQPDQLQIYFSK